MGSKNKNARLKRQIEDDYACTACGGIFRESQLITVTNEEWTLSPTDDHCCPQCESLAIKIEND